MFKDLSLDEIKTTVISKLKEISSDPSVHKDFITFINKFHKYSLFNQLLIFIQKNDASQVASFTAWKKIGRCVKRGEHGLLIYAPIIHRKTTDDKKTQTSRNDEAEDKTTDSNNDKSRNKQLFGFKIVRVFDISQTAGKPVAIPLSTTLDCDDPDELMSKLIALCEKKGYNLIFQNLEFAIGGYANRQGDIVINKFRPIEANLHTIIHELSHHYLGHLNENTKISRSTKEVEAELSAFLVCLKLGIPKGSHEYIESWGQVDTVVLTNALKISDQISSDISKITDEYKKAC